MGGSVRTKAANLVACSVIFRMTNMASNCTNNIFMLCSLKAGYGANDAVIFVSFSVIAILPSCVNITSGPLLVADPINVPIPLTFEI